MSFRALRRLAVLAPDAAIWNMLDLSDSASEWDREPATCLPVTDPEGFLQRLCSDAAARPKRPRSTSTAAPRPRRTVSAVRSRTQAARPTPAQLWLNAARQPARRVTRQSAKAATLLGPVRRPGSDVALERPVLVRRISSLKESRPSRPVRPPGSIVASNRSARRSKSSAASKPGPVRPDDVDDDYIVVHLMGCNQDDKIASVRVSRSQSVADLQGMVRRHRGEHLLQYDGRLLKGTETLADVGLDVKLRVIQPK